MYRTDADGNTATMPTPTAVGDEGYYQPGNPSTGLQATVVSHEHLNAIQEEISGVIEGMGLTLDKADNTQLLQALSVMTGIPDVPATCVTTDATATNITSIAVAEGEWWYVEAVVMGLKTGGAERFGVELSGWFYRNVAGNVTQEGVTTQKDLANDSGSWGGADLVANIANQSIDVQVVGKTATAASWKCSVKVLNI